MEGKKTIPLKSYLEKRALFPSQIAESPKLNLYNIIVIPCYNEPMVAQIVDSLSQCEKPNKAVEVIIVINASEVASPEIVVQNNISENTLKEYISNEELPFDLHYMAHNSLPKKHAGVGLARKIGMDEALYRLEQVHDMQDAYTPYGVITCLDADCTVAKNYLLSIENHFLDNEKCPGASIKYAHNIDDVSENTKEIIDYELHLRYYNQALKYIGLPYAYHTVGSSMAVRADAYALQGGMNKRKAGEDFYFLHKFIALSGFGHINDTTVYPSSRTSDRVPFGTGRAMLQMKEVKGEYMTYPFRAFEELEVLIESRSLIYKDGGNDFHHVIERLSKDLANYLINNIKYIEEWHEIADNTSSYSNFEKRFFKWLNAFWVMKYLNHYRLERGGVTVNTAAAILCSKLGNSQEHLSAKQLLMAYRILERE